MTRSGERCPIQWTNSAVTGLDGAVGLVVGTGTDLRRQLHVQRMAEALRASEARYAGIVSLAANVTISADAAPRIVLLNEGGEERAGGAARARRRFNRSPYSP